VLAALVAAGLWPLVGSRPSGAGLAVPPALLLAAAAATVALSPPDSPERPQGLPLTWVEEQGRAARLNAAPEASPLPAGLVAAAPFTAAGEPIVPWARRPRGFSAEVGSASLPAPELQVLGEAHGEAGRRLRLRLTSSRGAPALTLAFPVAQAPRVVRMEGRVVEGALERARRRGSSHVAYSCVTVPPGGLEVELELGEAPVDVVLADRSAGLPAAAQAVAAARPPEAVPVHEGDTTVVLRRLKL
jgi:hypothetical protein